VEKMRGITNNQNYILNELSKQILAGTVNKEHSIKIDVNGKGLTFSN